MNKFETFANNLTVYFRRAGVVATPGQMVEAVDWAKTFNRSLVSREAAIFAVLMVILGNELEVRIIDNGANVLYGKWYGTAKDINSLPTQLKSLIKDMNGRREEEYLARRISPAWLD